ncbi:unnamed protein product [Menidia menidia]|uniref:(Atlantic silverside) hypothetical protein n=1 Tax=Menidia menidia TaxID=238744 RepID=A0A8S4B4U0_9TELE|nr:unnamed protein product [Menidia menidia]
MAEARSEEEEENMRRDTREQVVRRQPNSSGGRPDRRKPEHRHSQGPLSSIRAAIKRTSTRSTSLSETPRERDRERDRDRERRRPEITILSAEPLASTSWFPGTAGGFPPPPPPAAQIWGPTIPPCIQPPPSYEEVIREKTQEQVLLPSSSSSRSAASRPASTITIATQTDPGLDPDPHEPQVRRPVRPARPPLPNPLKPSCVDDIATAACQSGLTPLLTATHPERVTHNSTNTQCCNLFPELCSPLTSGSRDQTDECDQSPAAADAALPSTSLHVILERPTPRPRSKVGIHPVRNEVKVQTLVKLREDGVATLARRAKSDSTNQEGSQGKYLQELLQAFSSDDWGFPDHRSDSSELSQSGSEEEEEDADGEDMGTLKARIQAFEQQQQAEEESCGSRQSGTAEQTVSKRPEPRPRPRLSGVKSVPPVIAPKPKNLLASPKPSSKVFWEDQSSSAAPTEPISAETSETSVAELDPTPNQSSEPSGSGITKSAQVLEPQPAKTTEKPSLTPKPQSVTEAASCSVPVPAPRPPPPKVSSLSSNPSPPNPRPPPRPPVAPRANVASQQDKSTVDFRSGAQTEVLAKGETPENISTEAVKGGSIRPNVQTKPAALTSPRRASAPNLAQRPISQTSPDPNPVASKLKSVGPSTSSKPPVPAPIKPPTPAPAPATRRSSVVQTKSEEPSTTNPNSSDPPRPSSVKLLPVRPPPIKSIPSRPPPPAVNLTSSANQTTPPSKAPPTSSVSPVTTSVPSSVTASQRVAKKGPPLPPRPKPGHPLYNSYMKQEVLIVLDDPSPARSEDQMVEVKSQSTITPIINTSQCLLDLDTQPEPVPDQDSQSKSALEDLTLSDSQSILPEQPAEQKEQPDPSPVSGPRCVARFDYEGEEEDELTFSQGDVIVLLELIGEEWGRGRIHGRLGVFPLNFTEVVEPLPQPEAAQEEMSKQISKETAGTESSAVLKTPQGSDSEAEEWVVALFDFPGQTEEDLSFHKGALIHVTEHIDAEWRKGKLEGRAGLFPAAFTQPSQAPSDTAQQPVVKGTAKALFDFTAESEGELTLKVGDMITQLESVDEQWIFGTVGEQRGIVPKNYISFL